MRIRKINLSAQVMKSVIVSLVTIIVCIHSVDAQELSTDIVFGERVYNFGAIKEEKGKVTHTFVFQNKGKMPVTISQVHSACGCIGKVVTEGQVKPGAKGKVTITFDPSYKSGFFSKEIVVLSNNNQQYNRIWVEGMIEPAEHPVADDYPYDFGNGLHLRLKVMAFGYVKPGETKQMELHYANDTDKEMFLNFVVDGNKKELKFTDPGKIGPKAKGVITFSYTMPLSVCEDVSFIVYPYVNNKKLSGKLEVKILNETTLKQSSKEPAKQKSK